MIRYRAVLIFSYIAAFALTFVFPCSASAQTAANWACVDTFGICYFAGVTTGNDRPASAANPQNAARPPCAIDYYGAPWCPPCGRFKPIVQNLASQFVTTFREFNIDQPNPLNYNGVIPFVKLWQWNTATNTWDQKWSGTGAMNEGALSNALWQHCAPFPPAPMPMPSPAPTPAAPIPTPIMPPPSPNMPSN